MRILFGSWPGYGHLLPNTSYFAAAIGAAISDAGLPDPTPDIFAAPYLDICPPGLQGTEPNPWTTIYPLRPSPGEIEPHAAVELDLSALPHPNTIYLTLGTIMNQTPKVFCAVIDGCMRWPVNLVVTTGPGLDPALLGPLPPAVRTAQFLPQAAVPPHCRAVASHAGAGTMLGALCYGLPQLCLPQGTDQPSNTAALVPTGAALALQPDEIADAVAEALGRLLNEPSFRQAANRLRAEIERMPTAAAVLHEVLVATDQ
jgi:UDP:flavonoid glycosyltransferase YjiC (YdhE family)